MGEERTINYANIVDENGQSLNMTSIVDNVKAIYELLNTGVLTVNVANVGSLSELGY